MVSAPRCRPFSEIKRFPTSTSPAAGKRARLERNNSSMTPSSDLCDFNRFATRVFPSAPTREQCYDMQSNEKEDRRRE